MLLMAKGDDGSIELVVRDLHTGDADHRIFESEDAACDWLRERPPFVDVLGVTRRLSPASMERLQESMRPLDEDEQREADALDERESDMAEAKRQIEEAVARGFMLENRWPGRWRNGD
jgi:hypothetical protein